MGLFQVLMCFCKPAQIIMFLLYFRYGHWNSRAPLTEVIFCNQQKSISNLSRQTLTSPRTQSINCRRWQFIDIPAVGAIFPYQCIILNDQGTTQKITDIWELWGEAQSHWLELNVVCQWEVNLKHISILLAKSIIALNYKNVMTYGYMNDMFLLILLLQQGSWPMILRSFHTSSKGFIGIQIQLL